MTDATTRAVPANGTLDLNDIAAADTADLELRHPATGDPLGWRITFAGPAHQMTKDLRARERRKRQREEMEKERARINGRKWHGAEKSPEDIDAETLCWVVDRIVAWTPVRINGEDYPFTRDNAMRCDHPGLCSATRVTRSSTARPSTFSWPKTLL